MSEIDRYLAYECNNSGLSEHHQGKGLTWGDILVTDYTEFQRLLGLYVRSTSRTFAVLSTCLKSRDDYINCRDAIVYYDSPAGQADEVDRYLSYKCTHKGRMNGKTWKEILKIDPSYIAWAVGNTMGRETKTYRVLLGVLPLNIQGDIESVLKGDYNPKKRSDRDMPSTSTVRVLPKTVDWGSYDDAFPPVYATPSSPVDIPPPAPLRREATVSFAK